MIPTFEVPPQYFYALAASMPVNVTADIRYRLATLADESTILDQLRKAKDEGVIQEDATVTLEMAARRLRAHGSVAGAKPVCASGVGFALVDEYRKYKSTPPKPDPEEDIAPFWNAVMSNAALAAAHLELVMCAVTLEADSRALIGHVHDAPPAGVGLPLDSVKNLDPDRWPGPHPPGLDFGDWTAVFTAFPADLPAITAPGTTTERISAFVRRLRKFFDVAATGVGPSAVTPGAPPTLPTPSFDPIGSFFAAYRSQPGHATFTWGMTFDETALRAAIAAVSMDARGKQWLEVAVRALNELYGVTDIGVTPELQFSLAEALYARGFVRAADVAALSLEDFAYALIGTPAYDHAAAIHAKAGGGAGPALPPGGELLPINPDGTLTDCVPPPELSPLGPVAYLHDLLGVSTNATCDEPSTKGPTLGEIVSKRRGPLGDLDVTRANAERPLPVIDLVNECLEAMVATGSPPGVVYDTARTDLAGHKLRGIDEPADEEASPYRHDPAILFGALAEHSSPATPVAQPGAYDKLAKDFSSPVLPYAQRLDVNRTYLGAMGASRFGVMRCFRKDITEFVLDPEPPKAPAAFPGHVWRYPVRIDIAREYLGISPEEYDLLFTSTPAGGLLAQLYGFSASDAGWMTKVRRLDLFLERTGLSYCELLDLWRSGFVKFHARELGHRETNDVGTGLPLCEPCYLDKIVLFFDDPSDDAKALAQLAVFIRLWRKLQAVGNAKYSFTELADIAEVLGLLDASGEVEPDFVRQLVAFQMLRDDFGLELRDPADVVPGTGADRTHVLALWKGESARKWDWAVERLIASIERVGRTKRHHHSPREPEFMKLLATNLVPLSRLCGFDVGVSARTWHYRPTHTLRFAEVLAKIYASHFGIGEVLYLFTADPHLGGDDPFQLADPDEAVGDPLQDPDDEMEHSLWRLRAKLLDVRPSEETIAGWTWPSIVAALRNDLGFPQPSGGTDPLHAFGAHFFPSVLERHGIVVEAKDRRFAVKLDGSNPAMWNTPDSPFFYEQTGSKGELRTEIPLRDEAALTKLSRIRVLDAAEGQAVRDLYHLPRLGLALFGFLFPSVAQADLRLVQEPDEDRRWAYFQRQFARFYARCEVIAKHLAGHVEAATEHEGRHTEKLAWKILTGLLADENEAKPAPWERDDGTLPNVTWKPLPIGGAFTAIVGLVGTGLLGEYSVDDGKTLVWRDLRGPMDAFGEVRNEWNVPVPTLVPALDLDLPHSQDRWAHTRNGIAIAAASAKRLGGAQGYCVKWTGVLLVEEGGAYRFWAGGPTPEGEKPDVEHVNGRRWHVKLRRGQKEWVLLSHGWPDEADCACSVALPLKRGAYDLEIELVRCAPTDDDLEDARSLRTGFQLKYEGPDTSDRLVTVPRRRLYRAQKDTTLAHGLRDRLKGVPYALLEALYTSSLRDIRRTYQRAFKALLFAHRFELSAERFADYAQSEIGYMLDHPDHFAGLSFYDDGGWKAHRASFDFNLLPLRDTYLAPPKAEDDRVDPSAKRQQALFDTWERTFDYAVLRKGARKAAEHPVWLLFDEADANQPNNPVHLLRHVDVVHGELVVDFWSGYSVKALDLVDERWATRVWKADRCIRAFVARFAFLDVRDAKPDQWAADDPDNVNLTEVVRDGLIENVYFDNPLPRRYQDLARLNDGLRARARGALLAYLCGMDRVPLPWPGGGFVESPKQLSELLLLDVEAGLCERASRVEEGITAVQTLVQRARLGLEPPFVPSPEFVAFWDGRFATFRTWQACVRRTLYRENWIEWEELESARRTEAFRFLEDQLRRVTLTIPVPGGLEYWDAAELPPRPALKLLQTREPSSIKRLEGPREGLGLLGTPERSAQRSWLAPLETLPSRQRPDGDVIGRDDAGHDAVLVVNRDSPAAAGRVNRPPRGEVPPPMSKSGKIPLWIESAIRLGARFVRVAAAGVPPAGNLFEPRPSAKSDGCCHVCGRAHEAVVDEYYFWLTDTRWYDVVEQDADWPGWHDDASLPKMLAWPSKPMVHLSWCRVHDGEIMQPRRSIEGVRVNEGTTPEIELTGRTSDSIFLTVLGGVPPLGHEATPTPGFRYDIAVDAAVVMPPVSPDATPPPWFDTLSAYPYFVYFAPGAPLFPLTPFAESATVAATLRAHCRFEAALKWYTVAWDPLHGDDRWCPGAREPSPNDGEDRPVPVVTHVPGVRDAAPAEPRSRRRRDREARGRSSSGRNVPVSPNPIEVHSVVVERAPDPTRVATSRVLCCRHAGASPDIARRRAITLDYLETLLAWGDCLMRGNSPEAFQQARLVYDTARKILGPTPLTVEVESPDDAKYTVSTFVAEGARLNPRLMAVYERIDDRLSLIHACLNGKRQHNGVARIDMPYFGDDRAIDGWKAPATSCDPEDCCCPGSPYRFTYLVQKATELASETRAFGAELLAAYEKGDGEYLAYVRAGHEHQIQTLMRTVRQEQWRDADWQVKALEKAKEIALSHRLYYATLLANGLVPGELDYQGLTNGAVGSITNATIMEAVATIMGVIPDVFVGSTSFVQLPLGTKLANVFSGIARISNEVAQILTTTAGLRLTQAGWQRREDDWRHQVEIYDLEIEQIERQILGAERRRSAALRELEIQQRYVESSREVLEILRDKFTNHQLYLWMQRETAALYYQMYELARCAALQAERAFNFERGYTTRKFVPADAWDDLRQGLLAGERLALATRRMEKAYLDENVREYELTKHVSLRMCFAHAFLALKLTGQCIVELPEWLFDLDYPGHYMRRIKSVSLTIPCVVGPYAGIHCRLTLLSSTTRIDPRLHDRVATCCSDDPPPKAVPPACSCWPAPKPPLPQKPRGEALANGYEALREDTRFVKHYAATEAIATSSGQNDSGMFELNFRDERYFPFELAGAVSRWRIELPPENNRFDLDSLSECVMHVNYTAREGGDVLRRAANEVAQARVPDDGRRVFDLAREMPDEWRRLLAVREGERQRFALRLSRDMFPFVMGDRDVYVTRLELLVEADGATPSTHCEVELVVPHRHGCAHAEHDEHELQLAAGSEWPGFYHGAVSAPIGPLRGRDEQHVGTFVYEERVERLTRAFLIVHYELR